MTLYRNTRNQQYYRARGGQVFTSKDTIVWWPSVFTEQNFLDWPDLFVIVEPPSITLENK